MQSNEQATLEIIAPSVEEAIQKGLQELHLPREAVEVDVLDEGSRGFLGLGARQARVRLRIKPQEPAAPQSAPEPPHQEEAKPESAAAQPPQAETPSHPAETDSTLETARDTVIELLEKMGVRASVSARYQEADTPNRRPTIWVDITGKDLSILIGRRAETLRALQYITSIILGKELGHSVPLVIDVEGYRERRTQQLRRLAQRMAEQAVKTGRRQALEPMPASERRIVHLALREYPGVTTESVGEEPRRKVTIIPTGHS